MKKLSEVISDLLSSRAELRTEFALLFANSSQDPPMAIARARRLLEILVVDRLAALGKLGPAKTGKPPSLYRRIETLTSVPPYSKELAGVCHAIRLEGNRVLHYEPGSAVIVEVAPYRLECNQKKGRPCLPNFQ